MILDIFLGVLVAKLVTAYFGVPFSQTFIIAGILFSLLPDFDLLKLLFKKGKTEGNKDYTHRDFIHYPIPYILLGSIAISFFGGSIVWLAIFTLATLLHFLHDSIGIGWGIKWLFPFSNKYFSFFYHYDIHRNKFPKKIIYSWTYKEVDELSKTGDKNWVRNIYLTLHPYSVTEHVITLLIIMFLFLK